MPPVKIRVSNRKLMEIGREKLQSSIKRAPSRTARKLALELLKGNPKITKYGNIYVPERLVTDAKVDMLLSRLKNSDRDTGYAIEQKLIAVKASHPIPKLLTRLRAIVHSKNGDLRGFAQEVLIRTKLRSPIPELKAALKDTNAFVRYYAIRTLGEMKVRSAIPDLKLALKSRNKLTSETAEKALRNMNVKI